MDNKAEKFVVLILGIVGLLFFVYPMFAVIAGTMLPGVNSIPGFYGMLVALIPFMFVIIAIAGVYAWIKSS